MNDRILRHRILIESVEIPDGTDVCPDCKGAGMVSKYDLGWTSVIHSEELATKRLCQRCKGKGYLPISET